MWRRSLPCLLLLWTAVSPVRTVVANDTHPGYELLINKPYLGADFDEVAFAEIWQVWPEPLRSQAEKATPVERRRMAFERYGLTPRPGESMTTENFKPLQYVVDDKGRWTMNCLACHGGSVLGQVIPGSPNNQFALQSFAEEMRAVKERHLPTKLLTRMEKAAFTIPLSTNRGTTNAVMFGVGLMALRDADLNLRIPLLPPRMIHHDMDAPPWWYFKKKTHLYAEAYAHKGPRPLMQFALVRSNGPEKFREWESDFEKIAEYLETLEPPKYPFPIDSELSERGRVLFERNCAECHGTYGLQGEFPNRVVALKEVKTDPVRFNAIRPVDRQMYGQSWFADYGKHETIHERDGYLAPPLDGVWASAPYFHNGSVPTLAQVLDSKSRPKVWRRTDTNVYDQKRGGLVVEELESIPESVNSPHDRREYFDTKQFGKSSSGHNFPDVLTEEEKQAVLEYLKTL